MINHYMGVAPSTFRWYIPSLSHFFPKQIFEPSQVVRRNFLFIQSILVYLRYMVYYVVEHFQNPQLTETRF